MQKKSHGVHINGPGSHCSIFFLFFKRFQKSPNQQNNKTAFVNIAVIPDEDVSDSGGLTVQCYNTESKSKQE